MGKIITGVEGVWGGYLLKFGDRVPGIQEDLYFDYSTIYDAGRLYTQGPVSDQNGNWPVGQVAHVKKDADGLHILVALDSTELPPTDELEWSYTVDSANIKYAFRDNPQSGEKGKVLTFYPLLSVHYFARNMTDAVPTSYVVVNRPAGRRRKGIVARGQAGDDPGSDSTG